MREREREPIVAAAPYHEPERLIDGRARERLGRVAERPGYSTSATPQHYSWWPLEGRG